MLRRLMNTQLIAILLALSLASLIALGSMDGEQVVPISRLPSVDSGMIVTVVGILTDLWIHDSGLESLVVTDCQLEVVVRVVCSCGIASMPSEYISIGDELSVTGEVSNDRLPPTIFAVSDHVELERSSEDVLTMQLLASHWQMFIDDSITVKGILLAGASGTNPRLVALDGSCSIGVMCGSLDADHLAGRIVTVTGTFFLDTNLMALYIDAGDIMMVAG